MKKTICHLIASNFFGGPEKQIVEHLQRLNFDQFRGIVASFLESDHNEILDRGKAVGLATHAIPMSGPLDIHALFRLDHFIANNKIELLCVHGYKATVMGRLCGWKNKIPVLAFSRGYTAENKKVAIYEWLDRQFLKRVDGIIAVSEGQRQKLASYGVNGKRSWVVHNAVVVPPKDDVQIEAAKQAIQSRFDIPVGEKIVVAAGRLSPEKGHRFLVDAAARLNQAGEKAFFVFCGDGPCYSALIEQSKKLGVHSRCRFPGFQRNIEEIFHAMDLMVLPSLTEGLPNVILEAFSLAKPVVATRVGGVPELVIDGKNGYVVEKERPDLLANAIAKSLADPEKMRCMGEAGYNLVKANFSFEGQNRDLEAIYQQMLINEK
jgi:glycosyltransferase involved in cell wall biosynthesis